MERKDLPEKFKVGDFVEDGDSSGIVVAGATSPTTGDIYYIFVESDGHLNGQFHYGLKSGLELDQPVKVFDLAGRELAATPQVAPAPDTTAQGPDAAQERRELTHYLEGLAERVRQNGRKGSSAVKAFAAFDAQFQSEEEPTWGVLQMACRAWRQLCPDEQRRILNGWRPEAAIPAVDQAFEYSIAAPAQETADRVRTVEFDGATVFATAETLLTHGLPNEITVTIREGTSRHKAITCLREAAKALEAHWDEVVNLEDRKFLRMPRAKAAAQAVGAEKKPRTGPKHSLKLGGQESQKSKAVAA